MIAVMKTVSETLLQRRSIRRYEREPIPDEALQFIYDAVRNTSTSYNGQQFSVIDIDDQNVKEQLYALTNQKQIKTCNHFLVFCADYNKIWKLADKKGLEIPAFQNTIDGIMVGVIDAALAMQNALTAALSYGLGCCCIGYARTAAPEEIAELLKLPKGVFVVCGLAIGVPREMPDMKPKQPQAAVVHKNSYADTDEVLNALVDYDAEISLYNQNRSGSKSDNDWCGHILEYYREALSYHMLEYLKKQGFSPDK